MHHCLSWGFENIICILWQYLRHFNSLDLAKSGWSPHPSRNWQNLGAPVQMAKSSCSPLKDSTIPVIKPQLHCDDFRHGQSHVIWVDFALVIQDKLLQTPSTEDAATTGVGMIVYKLTCELHFIAETPWLIQYSTQQPYEWAWMRFEEYPTHHKHFYQTQVNKCTTTDVRKLQSQHRIHST